jgi:purine-binding chemotaxis protein CheW
VSSASEVAQRQQYLVFTLAAGDYGVSILKVKEILQYEEITRVPSTPRSIRGVLNLRGSVVPVVDLAVKFGLSEAPVTKRTCVLVVETVLDGLSTVMGLVADAVSEVIELGADDIEEPPSFGTRVRVDYLVGMGKVERKFVLLLDIEKVLSADERELAAAAAQGEILAQPAGDAIAAAASAPDAPPAEVPATST